MVASTGLQAVTRWLEDLGLPPHAQKRLLWASVGGLCLLYAARRLSGAPNKAAASTTDFNSFLVADVPKRKGLAEEKPLQSTDFNSFLKQQRPAPKTTDFNAFLKVLEEAEGESDVDEAAEEIIGPAEDQVAVTVLFGTEYGFAKEIAEKLCGMLREGTKYWPRLLDMSHVPGGFDLAQEQAVLVICSTQGDGVPPSEARDFCDWLGSENAPKLATTNFSVCALGDTSYTHFCACGKQLDARLEALGGARFTARQDINREDWPAVNAWLAAVLEGLAKLSLLTVAESGYSAGEVVGDGERITKNRPWLGTVVEVEGLCNVQSVADKDTVRVEIDLADSGLAYIPGDALGIHASNAPEVVQELLGYLGVDPKEQIVLPAWHYADAERPAGSQISLQEGLTHCYDLRVPKPELLKALWDSLPAEGKENGVQNGRLANSGQKNGSHKSSISQQRAALGGLLQASEQGREKYLEPRHVIDVLLDFPAARIRVPQLLAGLRPLQPRLYSISSSPLEDPSRVQVTVATVRYSSLGKDRLGVASTYLAERIQVGHALPVYVAKNPDFRLPSDPAKPIIMVGPGTGLAPFRAFMQQRLLGGEAFGPCLLYFGCRRSDQDYLYGRQLEGWAKEGHLELYTAFSRQQAKKVYVQDRLRESAARVWELLEAGGHFYVCGDASHMAADVEKALLDILADNQGGSKEAAEAYLERLRSTHRYQRDVWY